MFDRESLYDKIDDLDSEVRRLRLLLLRARRQIDHETFLKAPEDWLSVLRDIDAELEEENAAPAPPAAEQPWPSGCHCNTRPGPCENCGQAEQPDTVAVPRELLERVRVLLERAAKRGAIGWIDCPTTQELRALLGREGE